MRELLESRQVVIYFFSVAVAAAVALAMPGTSALETAVNPALALMLYVTFLQVPLAELGHALRQGRFLVALLVTNFVAIPVLVAVLARLLPVDPMVQLGVLLVLLTPCIDYVVTFSHLGRADARLLLAATPVLLILQMLLLPGYLWVLLGKEAVGLVQFGPFMHAFAWLIALPLLLAGATQAWAVRTHSEPASQRCWGSCRFRQPRWFSSSSSHQ
ncbi:putative membrane protein [Bordetella petrii]|uniref:Membrane protein n=1 Tax=Bordetella petrii (strain ATCC BAA-461 / DSM 12804 / CCUG 43448 / CIP 107267 / Se-1111R) TaxID=340100 RepID=A9I9A0_BORPD|nr:putative membrane protein [Bordetella petrii]